MAGTDRSISQSFRERADSACFWEAWVGSVLSRAGLYTLHHPFTIAGDVGKELSEYAHSWDLDVGTNPSDERGDMEPVEIKSLTQGFTSVKDYPFADVFVCSQASYLKKWPGAETTRRHFLFVSRQTGAILWLPSGSKVVLGGETVDRTRNELYKVVKAKVADLRELSEFCEVIRGV